MAAGCPAKCAKFLLIAFNIIFWISDLIKKNLMDDIETKNFTMGKDSDGKIIYTDIGKNLNLFQEEFHCCGLNNSSDYTKLTDKDVFVKKIPYSCYKLNDEKKKITMPQFTDVDLKKLNNKGCKDELIKWFEDNTIILIGIAIGIACLEIFGVIFAVCLCRNPSREEYQ
ncbi:hypothetical protein LSH36_70g07044 [Paralvinella palmiformis]|uniref:Tetraspanin n=1 Tax=Paralvinella palmiformis TaxID=53620 RepID=A0AAD9NDA5_9ANNE|nr:hypothetical protein LSH36_70g07044 [Paralvinella palmiformis]